MELWEDVRDKLVTGFRFLIFKIYLILKIFSFQDNLKGYYNLHVTKNRSKDSSFPEHHWVASSMIYAFHPTFFQLGVSLYIFFEKTGKGIIVLSEITHSDLGPALLIVYVMYQTRRSVSSGIQTPRSRLKKQGAVEFL